ncbi:putative molybdopterin biosynthesis protein [Variovorax boronicumulans]|uniref:Molybdopterin molybdenumtransferase n=1 Tax=Variovorax boronicumulans TaxID=436515 RepID=A0AAW8E2E6_9BURK|nr:molybdopterin biosynthesis protein [Variovorax boronicumulans]MDP9880700.1 putative molybdopterin biosynthesis protein [Variovorax boronicumulans]MDP9920233.1 putative molybdopterin biosynthesis protein [Variovorax boronicumulans]MDP9925987.1 putative molybdopterin biosynthesis protein [Variovorax boronicumulans]
MKAQSQFLDVVTRDEAERRFREHLSLAPLGRETVPLHAALGRVLADDAVAAIDVPGFDRSNVDGFAVQAADTWGAMEEQVRALALVGETLAPGIVPQREVTPGHATAIATGGMLPRGADAVVMVEHTDLDGGNVQVRRAATAGENVSYAGTDIARGETVLRAGQVLSSREIGVLAALGLAEVGVWRKPRVAIFSTGNEIVAPGAPLPTGAVYDSNAAIIGAAVEELGGEPVRLGVIPDDEALLSAALARGLACDAVVFSGGTSKGEGDLSYRVVAALGDPGVVAHGVALKPGKPVCLAVTGGKPVVILPGFPTSAVFTFHEFLAPVIRAFAGRPPQRHAHVAATLPMRVNSERGRTEYLLVGLVPTDDGVAAYPMGKGSSSVTTFSSADGFITIGQHTEIVDAGAPVQVQLLGQGLDAADLIFIGSHCVGLDWLAGELMRQGIRIKAMNVGSTGGLMAARRGECDVAGIHLMDPATGVYNRPLLTPDLELVTGYGRMQGVVHRPGDTRFEGLDAAAAIAAATAQPGCTMVNRNAGSGTRILIDRLLGGAQPPGYGVQTKSHNAVAVAVAQQRADWGLAIDTVARQYGLGFIPVQEERYDFVVPQARLARAPVQAFIALLQSAAAREALDRLGFRVDAAA